MDEDVGVSRRIEFPKHEAPEVEVYTIEEVNQILKATDFEPIHIRTLVEIALFTGLRRGEIVGLKWEDIDLEKKRLSVRRSIYKPKDGKAQEKTPKSKCSIRTIAIPDRLCETLKAYKANQERHASYMGSDWQNLGYVFTEKDGYTKLNRELEAFVSVDEKPPKKDRRKAAYEVFILPVRPMMAGTNLGSLSACRKNSFNGERKTNARVG